MNTFKSLFITALLSNKFNQCQEYLYHKGRFDAVGLACYLAGIKTDILEDVCGLPADYIYDDIKYNLVLPNSLKGSRDSVADKLALMNDNGSSFAEIAEWLIDNTDEELNFIAQAQKIAA